MEEIIDKKLKLLEKYGIKKKGHNLMFYVLAGFETTQEEDVNRVKFLRERGVAAYVMPYLDTFEVKLVKTWANNQQLFNVSWEEFKGDKDMQRRFL